MDNQFINNSSTNNNNNNLSYNPYSYDYNSYLMSNNQNIYSGGNGDSTNSYLQSLVPNYQDHDTTSTTTTTTSTTSQTNNEMNYRQQQPPQHVAGGYYFPPQQQVMNNGNLLQYSYPYQNTYHNLSTNNNVYNNNNSNVYNQYGNSNPTTPTASAPPAYTNRPSYVAQPTYSTIPQPTYSAIPQQQQQPSIGTPIQPTPYLYRYNPSIIEHPTQPITQHIQQPQQQPPPPAYSKLPPSNHNQINHNNSNNSNGNSNNNNNNNGGGSGAGAQLKPYIQMIRQYIENIDFNEHDKEHDDQECHNSNHRHSKPQQPSPPPLPIRPLSTSNGIQQQSSNERYQQSYQNFQKHSNDIDFQKQFRIQNKPLPNSPPPSYSDTMNNNINNQNNNTTTKESPVVKEGLLYYNFVTMGSQKGTLDDIRWFILRDHLLFNHVSKDTKAIDAIDLRRLILNIDIRLVDDSDSFRFGLRLRSPNNSIAHFLWSDDPKQAIMWIVAVGHHTINFSQESEMEMINQILEISQPEAKPNLIVFNENDKDNQLQQFEYFEKKKLEIEQQKIQQQINHQQQLQQQAQQHASPQSNSLNTSPIRKNSSSSSFFDELFKSQRKSFKQISQNADNRESVVKTIEFVLSQKDFDIGEAFDQRVVIIQKEVVKLAEIKMEEEFDVKTVKKLIDDLVYDYTQLLVQKISEMGRTEERINTAKAGVEKAVFNQIYPTLFPLYKTRYASEDEEHTAKMLQFLTLTPIHLSIPQKFWLLDETTIERQVVPYATAIDILKKLPSFSSPSEKIQCLVDTSDSICESINSFWTERNQFKPESLVLGADDLLPLFTYVIIKSKLTDLYSESIFLQDFLDESLSTRIQGYFLITYQTCLSLLCVWEINELLQNASKLFDQVKTSSPTILPQPNKTRSQSLPSSSLSSPIQPLPQSSMSSYPSPPPPTSISSNDKGLLD